MKASPKYMTKLIPKVEQAIWGEFSSYKNVKAYILRFQEIYDEFNGYANFDIVYKDGGQDIDLSSTLFGIKDDELIFKIALDIGVVVPDLIYSIPEIKGILASGYEVAHTTFENALKKVIDEPNTSICCANSALESIIKHICEDKSVTKCNQNHTLYKLTTHLLKEFKYFPDKKLNDNIKNIGSSLLSIAQSIETIRSNHTDVSHGKISEDYIIDDEIYAKFLINAVSTVGLFLLNYYEKKYKPSGNIEPEFKEGDIPF